MAYKRAESSFSHQSANRASQTLNSNKKKQRTCWFCVLQKLLHGNQTPDTIVIKMESGTLNEPPAKQTMEKTSAVRVGVRVRPFTSKEISASRSNESVLTCIRQGTQEIRLGSRRFTYDAVFDESVSQEALYRSVGGPLMENFLEGFNATVRHETTILGSVVFQNFSNESTAYTDNGLWSNRFREDLYDGQ